MRDQERSHDVVVVGGGLAGVCAAIAAARRGRSVALINNRPVLGGNSSSEIRVWVVGATAHGRNHYARETGIMGELWLENQYRNSEGNPHYWDAVVLDAVRAEPNIDLHLNTDVHTVEADGPEDARRILSVTGWTMGSELRTRFPAGLFVDCTGDGLVGHLAGAEYRIGREARSEFGEPWAPDQADDLTLGSSLFFYSTDAGRPVRFVAPSFTRDIATTAIPHHRIIRSDAYGCAYWWIEYGGELDTIHDNERIRDELWSAAWGIWDYIKNSGNFEADTLTLEWIGAVPGKRESRRFLGEYVLTQADVLGQAEHTDRVAFGGWSIDHHPPGGMYATEAGARQRYADGIYHIPYRMLYSRNVTNMLMAGRNVSASHVAYGTTRVMATCAVMGEAAGLAAALSAETGVQPRDLDVNQLQQELLHADASIIGLRNRDQEDHALSAAVWASGWLSRLDVEDAVGRWPLDSDAGLVIPVDPELAGLELLVDAAGPTELVVEAYDPGPGQNYVPRHRVAVARVPVAASEKQWVRVDLAWRPETPRNLFLLVKADAQLALYVADLTLPGVLSLSRRPLRPEDERPQPLREWTDRDLSGRTLCFRGVDTAAYAPAKLVDGYQRPYAGPHQWVSNPLADAAWVELSWREPLAIVRIEVTADDDLDEDLVNLHRHKTPYEVPPTLVRDYRIDVLGAGGWRTFAEMRDNRRRRTVHELTEQVTTDAVRVVVTATNGADRAHLVAVRVYSR